MIGKKINELATELAPASTDLTIIGNPTTGVSKKITLAQLGAIFSGAVSFYTNYASFPATGTLDVIFCAKDTKKLYLWNGSAYVEVFPSQALLDTYQLRSEKGVSNGYASLDSSGKVPVSQLPSSIMEYKGTWSAATNTPTLANGTGDTGDVYICNAAGSVNFGAGSITFAVGDYVIYSGSIWQRSSGAVGTVTSVGASITGNALTISGSPVTTSGTLAFAFAGTGAQYIKGDGTLATFPSIISQAQNLVSEVYNNTGATLTKGTVVYINGGQGNLPTVTKALATGDSTSAQTYGIVQADITNNNNGYVVVAGRLENMDTQALANGTQLYLSSTTAGAYTSTKQYAPAHLVYVGIIVRSHPTQGIIEVKIQNGYELDEIHNVSAQTPSNNDGLFWEASTSLWKNKSLSTIIGGTPAYGSGTQNRIPKFTANAGQLIDSNLHDTGTVIYNNNPTAGQFAWQFNGSQTTGQSYGALIVAGTNASDIAFRIQNASSTSEYFFVWGDGRVQINNIPNATTDTDRFLVSDSGVIKYRTGAELLSDIGGQPAGTYVTSVGLSAPTGFDVSGSPVTSSGTLALSFSTGYSLPTTAKQGNWDTAYNTRIVTASSPLSFISNTLSIAQASGSQNGYLSSTDWNTFNNKQAAGNYVTLDTFQTITASKTFSVGFSLASAGGSNQITSFVNANSIHSGSSATNVFGFNNSNNIYFGKGLSNGGVITFNNSAVRFYALQDASGTLAFTSDLTGGTVTSVGLSSATSGVTIGSSPVTTSGTITLAIATASGSQQGLLSSTDWTTFNNKQSALTNPVTGTGTTNYLPKFTGTSTIGNSGISDDGTTVTLNSRALTVSTSSSTAFAINSSASTAFMGMSDSSGSYVYLGSDNGTFLIQTPSGGYSTKLTLNDSGNLGLGVTPSAWSAFNAFDIGSAGNLASYNNTADIQLNSNAYFNGINWIYKISSTASRFRLGGNEFQWFTAPSGTAGNAISFTQAMTLNASGNLTLGTTSSYSGVRFVSEFTTGVAAWFITGGDSVPVSLINNGGTLSTIGFKGTSTANAFNVRVGASGEDFVAYTSNTERLRISSTGAATFSSDVTIGGLYTFSSWTTGTVNKIRGYYGNDDKSIQWNYNNSPAGTVIKDNNSFLLSVNSTNTIFANSSGNVGIGTTSPLQTSTNRTVLTVNGTTNSLINIAAGGSLGSSWYTDGSYTQFYGIGSTEFVTGSANPLIFSTNNSEKMRITSGGNVGIGATSPTSISNYVALTINGTNGSFTEYQQGGSYAFRVGSDSSIGGFISQTGANAIRFLTNDTERMRITSGGELCVGRTSAYGAGFLLNVQGNIYASAAITTGAPSGGSAGSWKLGTFTSGTFVQGGKVRVEINGVAYDLLTT